MTPERLEYFSNFLFDMSDEDFETVREALKQAEIDPEESKAKVLKQIEKAEVELRIAKGRKFKEDYLDALNDSIIDESKQEPVTTGQTFSFAYRKGEDSDDYIDDSKENEKKLKILKILTDKNKQK